MISIYLRIHNFYQKSYFIYFNLIFIDDKNKVKMAAVLPYRVEYAIGPNICKRNGCNLNCNDELQYAIMEHVSFFLILHFFTYKKLIFKSLCFFFIKSPADDCATPIWFHVECFFAIRRPISECVIEGFGNLRLNHQKEIIQFLSNILSVYGVSL